MELKYRARNGLGAKVLKERVFLIQNGEVTRAQSFDEDFPRSLRARQAIWQLADVAVERVSVARPKLTPQNIEVSQNAARVRARASSTGSCATTSGT